jgi:hypothetical protein
MVSSPCLPGKNFLVLKWSMQRAQILNADVLSAKKRPALDVSALWVFIDALDAS